MKSTKVPFSTLEFLQELRKNNNRNWFNARKDRYRAEHARMIAFADALIDAMNHYDKIETMSGKDSLFRIYRDIRFSKDKSPYKTHFSGSLKRATRQLRGGYYFHIEPGGSFLGGGFWGPNPADLKRIREEIAADDKPLRKILADPVFIKTFGSLKGDSVKTAPKGFSKDHPAIDLIRHKQFIISRSFTDEEALSPDFLEQVVQTFRNMRPFFDYMSEVLTTDSDGAPLF